jgi:CubicO group peptidase (beta-lactamase class C family)
MFLLGRLDKPQFAMLRLCAAIHLCAFVTTTHAASPVAEAPLAASVDAVANEWLAATGAPSASIAIIQHGKLAYAQAYGEAVETPSHPATTATRYDLDSVSKEFTATAILMLAEQGKLSLDDPLRKWFPSLGPAAAVTLRQVLSHTGGLRDFWPQDFVTPEMTRPTTTAGIIEEWVQRPLDFEPGTEWQYSNTGFVMAAAVVQRVSGEDLFAFLQHRVFTPLAMSQVREVTQASSPEDAVGYTRYGLGPVHEAPKEAAGWLQGSAFLVMSPSDLARWDLSLLHGSVLRPASYQAQFTPTLLKNGSATSYGLGLDIEQVNGRLRIGHAGGGSGFLAENRLWPKEDAAVVVLTNNDWASPSDLADRLAFLVLAPTPAEQRIRTVFEALQRGTLDRSVFTDIGNAYLTDAVLADLQSSLAPLGPMRLLELEHESRRGGLINRRWKVLCAQSRLEVIERGEPGGKLEQFFISKRED